jgi:hypothetical protein
MSAVATVFEPRGVPAPAALGDARVELHWAAQIVAAVGRALIPAVADDSHTSLEWVAAGGLLLGGATPAGSRLGVRPADLTLVLHAPRAGAPSDFPLAGRTLDEARHWVADRLGDVTSVVPPYEMPPHAVGRGGTFTGADGAALAELARWYSTADGLLRTVRQTQTRAPGQASPVRCWPHHFDIATLIELPRGASPDARAPDVRTIGVGLSPGDGSYPEPYFYVTPWPYPANPDDPPLPVLPGGAAWHRTGWFGAVLTGTAIFAVADGSPATGAEIVSQFLKVAAVASAARLGVAR